MKKHLPSWSKSTVATRWLIRTIMMIMLGRKRDYIFPLAFGFMRQRINTQCRIGLELTVLLRMASNLVPSFSPSSASCWVLKSQACTVRHSYFLFIPFFNVTYMLLISSETAPSLLWAYSITHNFLLILITSPKLDLWWLIVSIPQG